MIRLFPRLLCLPFLPACLAAAGLPLTSEERLLQLEARLARIETQLAAVAGGAEVQSAVRDFRSLQRELGWDGKSSLTVARAGGRERKLSIGGFVHTHAEFGGAPDSRYTGIHNRVLLRRARITTKGSFAEGFEFVLQPDFGNNSIAGNTGYRGGFADAYVAWNKHEAATVQLGQFKSAFGYEQLLSDTKTPMVERSLPNDLLTFSRQIGAAVLGSVWNRRISYNVGAYNGNGVNNGNNDNDQFMYAGRISACAWSSGADKWTVAANGLSTRDSGAFSGRRTSWGLDSQLSLGRFECQAEYLHALQNRDVGADATMAGWSLLAGYFVVPKTWQALVRYETYDANTRIPATTSATWVLGANFLLQGDDIKFAFNYYLGDPAGAAARTGRFMSRVQIVF